MSKRTQRLVDTRRKQRDEAAQVVAERKRQLEALRAAKLRLQVSCKEELEATVGRGGVSATRLELLHMARRAAQVAESRGEEALASAKDQAMACEVRLRQVEILRDRQAEKRRNEERRKERRAGTRHAQ